MRVTRTIDATEDEIENAKQTAVALIGQNTSKNAIDLFYTDNLEEIENGIRNLNEFSSKCWLLSSILLYTLIYNHNLYQQSGLDWFHYAKQARERLGIDNREITEMLGAARFFIKYHEALQREGFVIEGSNRKLARAELALKLSGDVNATIKHISHDTCREFNTWYSYFKKKTKLLQNDRRREDVRSESGRFFIGDVEAVSFSDRLSEDDSARLREYMRQIFDAIRNGYEPAIVPVYDRKEAAIMPKLRDKFRKGK